MINNFELTVVRVFKTRILSIIYLKPLHGCRSSYFLFQVMSKTFGKMARAFVWCLDFERRPAGNENHHSHHRAVVSGDRTTSLRHIHVGGNGPFDRRPQLFTRMVDPKITTRGWGGINFSGNQPTNPSFHPFFAKYLRRAPPCQIRSCAHAEGAAAEVEAVGGSGNTLANPSKMGGFQYLERKLRLQTHCHTWEASCSIQRGIFR